MPRELTLFLEKFRDRYFLALLCLLGGYAIMGRGLAGLGIKPFYPGEVMLLLGLGSMLLLRPKQLVEVLSITWPIVLFMAWNAFCALPYLSQYGIDTIRDSMMWGYAVFAIIIASLFLEKPERFEKLVTCYAKFAIVFLALNPIVSFISRKEWVILPMLDSPMGMFYTKVGDQLVHMGGVVVFIALFGGVPLWYALCTIPVGLGVAFNGRAAVLSFTGALFGLIVMRPASKIIWRLALVLMVGFGLFWASGIKFTPKTLDGREISAEQLINNVLSIFGAGEHSTLHGTKEWREKWWHKIWDYTFHGPYYWTGKGWGISLAAADGFEVGTPTQEKLRSPHNGHMTYLARSGVPGFVGWITLQLGWGAMMAMSLFRAQQRGDHRWASMFTWLGAYWVAFLINTSFDVFLEGPMGGIVFWSLFGTGLAAVRVYSVHCTQANAYANPDRSQLLPAIGR